MAQELIGSKTYRIAGNTPDEVLTGLLTKINETLTKKGLENIPLKWVDWDLDRIYFEDETLTVRMWNIRPVRNQTEFRISLFKQND